MGPHLYPKDGAVEFICLSCTLPECDEQADGCAYRKLKPRIVKTSRWAQLHRRVAQLKPGDLLTKTLPPADVRSAQASLRYQASQGNVPTVKMWTVGIDGLVAQLHILRPSTHT